MAARGFAVRSLSHTPSETMAVLAQTCKIALPARVAARSGKTARRTAIVAKAAAPVDAVRVQQKVRRDAKTPAIVSARNSARQSARRATRSGSSPRVARPRRARLSRRCAWVVTTHRSRLRAEGRGRPRVARAETRACARCIFFLRDERLARGLPTGRATRAGAVDRRMVSIVGQYHIRPRPVRSRRSS